MKQMTQKRKSLRKDKRGFTGLEAAIVLTAFIVVAAVFSYMVLGAGFFSTEKAKAVVHTGVEQATSSVELAGDVIGQKGTNLKNVTLYIKLTAGENPVDLSKVTISYADENRYDSALTAQGKDGTLTGASEWKYSFVEDKTGTAGDNDVLLEKDEMAKLKIWLPVEVASYAWFQVEVKPEQGGVLGIKRTVPGAIDNYMVLN